MMKNRTIKRLAANFCRTAWTGALAATLAAGFTPKTASACAVVPYLLHDFASTKSEEAFIVWDEAKHLEHFIRIAKFEMKSPSFAFIVPVPHPPSLGEADGVAAVWQTEIRMASRERVPHFTFQAGVRFTTLWGPPAPTPVLSAPPPQVLEEKSVAGLESTVLEARDAEGLGVWLAARQFPMRDALQRWISGYVAKGWTFVVFRYEAGSPPTNPKEAGNPVQIRSVRITFPTDYPIYPYLEPDDAPVVPNRSLHLYLVASTQMTGFLTGGERRPWVDGPTFSKEIKTDFLSNALGIALPSRMWLTSYVDRATKRAPSDLVFSPEPHVRVVGAPKYVYYSEMPIPVDVLAAFGLALLLFFRARKRRQSLTPAASVT